VDFIIDGRAETVYCGPGMTLKEVLDYYHRQLLEQHRVVVGIAVNGVRLDTNSEAALQKTPAGQVSRLELTTSPMRRVAVKVFHDTRAHLASLAEGFDEVARRLERRHPEQVWDILRACLENWSELLGGLTTAANAVGLDFEEVNAADGRSFAEVLEELQGDLRELLEHLGEQSPELLVDQIDQQIIPLLEDCEEAVGDMVLLAEQPLH